MFHDMLVSVLLLSLLLLQDDLKSYETGGRPRQLFSRRDMNCALNFTWTIQNYFFSCSIVSIFEIIGSLPPFLGNNSLAIKQSEAKNKCFVVIAAAMKKRSISLPASIEANDRILTRAVASDDPLTAVVTALRQVKCCNEAAINTLFPGHTSPWEPSVSSATPQRILRASKLLALAQRYLSVVDEYTGTSSTSSSSAPSPPHYSVSTGRGVAVASAAAAAVPLPPPGTVERLCAAWPTVVTQSHLAIVAFYQGRARLALGYIEAAIATALRASVAGGISRSVPAEQPSVDDVNFSSAFSSIHEPQQQRPKQSQPLLKAQRRSSSPASTQKRTRSPSPATAAAAVPFYSGSDNRTSAVMSMIPQLRPAAANMVRAMDGSTLCAAQLVVLLLNYSRVLCSLGRYEAARDCAVVARGMLADLQELAFARAAHVMAEIAQDQSQDWPSLLNGRTSLPLMQSLCAFTSGDVELLARPADAVSLQCAAQWLREADATADAMGMIGAHENPYRRMIADRLSVAEEQLAMVRLLLRRTRSSPHQQQHQQRKQMMEPPLFDSSFASCIHHLNESNDGIHTAAMRNSNSNVVDENVALRNSLASRLRLRVGCAQQQQQQQPTYRARSSSLASPPPRCPTSMAVVPVHGCERDTFVACGSPAKLRGVLQTFRDGTHSRSVLKL